MKGNFNIGEENKTTLTLQLHAQDPFLKAYTENRQTTLQIITVG